MSSMANDEFSTKGDLEFDEDEIFKTLSHQIRRNIIKYIGNKGSVTFSEIRNQIGTIDSPSLSYHLKSLQPLLMQGENKYKLSSIGDAAFNLLRKTDQSIKISRYRKHFLYAYIITVACWISASTIIPIIIGSNVSVWTIISVQIAITIISTINYIIIWQLRKRY